MVSLTKKGGLPVETGRFFRDLYLVLLGSEKGPRAAPFLAVLEKDWVLRRRSEEHTSELQSRSDLVCRLLLEKKTRRTTSMRPRPTSSTRHSASSGSCIAT